MNSFSISRKNLLIFIGSMVAVGLFWLVRPTQAAGNCVVPSSGPWPMCARGGGADTAPQPTEAAAANGSSCTIPESGPWPACATSGNQAAAQPVAPTKSAAPSATKTPPAPLIVGESTWQAEYYNNYWFSGNPVVERQDGTILFDWGQGSPHPKIEADNFSVKWRKEIVLAAPTTYKFEAKADNFLKLYVNSQEVLDVSVTDGEVSAEVELKKGKNWIYVEYKEEKFAANVSLIYWPLEIAEPHATVESTSVWQPTPAATPPPTAQPVSPGVNVIGDWKAEYFSNAMLAGQPAFTRTETGIDFDWGNGAPVAGVSADNFSVRWTRTYDIKTASIYRIEVKTTDRVRMLFDGKPYNVVEGNTMSTNVGERRYNLQLLLMRPGIHTVTVELYDLVNGAKHPIDTYSAINVSTRAEKTNLDIAGLQHSFQVNRVVRTQTGIQVNADYSIVNAVYPSVTGVTYPNPKNNNYGNSRTNTFNVHTDTCDYEEMYFRLWATIEGTRAIVDMVTLKNDYPSQWFFTPTAGHSTIGKPCANMTTMQASTQRFQHGRMIWIDNPEPNSKDRIIVVVDGAAGQSKLYEFTDYFSHDRDPVRDPALTPPTGLIQPEYGFGKIWREQLKVRSDLGWAIEQPENYTANYQRANHYFNEYRNTGTIKYFTLPDGQVIELLNVYDRMGSRYTSVASWRFVPTVR